MKRSSSANIVTGLQAHERGSIPGKGAEEISVFTTASRLDLRPIQPPVRGPFPQGKPSGGGGGKLTTHLQLMQRLRMRGATSPLPDVSLGSA